MQDSGGRIWSRVDNQTKDQRNRYKGRISYILRQQEELHCWAGEIFRVFNPGGTARIDTKSNFDL